MSEPKVEPWMESAGKEIADRHGELVDGLSAFMDARTKPDDPDPSEFSMRWYAAIIAKHAPRPEDQPIRVGDVVQVTSGENHRDMIGIVVVSDPKLPYPLEVEFKPDDTEAFLLNDCTRLGRAHFMPDGSPV